MVAYAKKRLRLQGKETKQDFERLYKSCKNARLKERYHAMFLSYDYEWKEVAKILGRSYEQVLLWVKAYNKHGIGGLVSKKQKGNQPKLTPAQKDELNIFVTNEPRALGYDFSNWNTKILKVVIKDKFGIEMSQESVRRNLRKLGFVWKKPEHRFVLSDKQEQANFTRLLRKTVKERGCNEVILFEDECTLKQHPTLKNTWILKGMRKFIGTFGNHAKRNVFGFVNVLNGKLFAKVTDSLNSNDFIACLECIKRIYKGMFVKLNVDNGPCHTSKKTKNALLTLNVLISQLLNNY
jgi:transposase